MQFGASYWPSSHNSFNSTAYPGASSSGDPNQSLTVADQLALGIREIEFDVHWYPHTASAGNAPVLCHARGASENHLGCGSTDRHLREGLLEIQTFLNQPENADTILMLDIENNLADFVPPNGSMANDGAHTTTANLIESILGDFLYKPAQTGSCQALPLNISRADILAAGKNLIIVSNCGTNSTWRNVIFDFGASLKQQAHTGFTASPDCQSADFSANDYATKWIRLWHDSTQIGANTNPNLQPINANTLKNMNECGVNTASLDQILVNDSRFTELVWSWAVGQPAPNTTTRLCAQHRADGRFEPIACTAQTPQGYACKTGNTWQIAAQAGVWSSGQTACVTAFGASARFATPETAEANLALKQAKTALSINNIWLNYAESVNVTGDWRMDLQ